MTGSIARWTAGPIAALLLSVLGSPASATSNRVWVSGHGVDAAGCGAPTNPCRSLQYAHDNAASAGGEIDILDPAGYGAITISKAISIVNDGVGTAGVQAASGPAITINAGPTDAVYLKGLNVDGVQRRGADGLLFNSGGSLTVADCVFRNFLHYGAYLKPTSGAVQVLIEHSEASDNGGAGVYYEALSGDAVTTGALDHVFANGNGVAGMSLLQGSGATGAVSLTITNSVASNNGNTGFEIQSSNANAVATMDMSTVSGSPFGVVVQEAAVLHLARSVINQNSFTGIFTNLSGGGALFTSGDNQLHGNVVELNGTLTPEPHS